MTLSCVKEKKVEYKIVFANLCGKQIMCKNQIKNINLLENSKLWGERGWIYLVVYWYNNNHLIYSYIIFDYFYVQTCSYQNINEIVYEIIMHCTYITC